MNLLLRGDSIINRLSKTKHLPLVTFVIAFLEATISPILPEAFLLVVLAYRKDISWKLLSFISALGSASGALGMYLMGRFFYATYGAKVMHFLHGEAFTEKAKSLFEANAFSAQFFASLTPLPDRVFSFLAGAFFISPIIIFTATFLGRLVRVAIPAYLSYEYGDEARVYIKRHTRLAGVVVVVCGILYVLYKYFT